MASFQVAARALIHLGSELITSDPIAIYELIKNGKRDQAMALVEEMVLYIMKLYLHEGD